MNHLLYLSFLIFSIVISYVHTQDKLNSSNGLGESGCHYFGGLDALCGEPVVPVSCLPKECSSYMFNGISVNSTYHVFDSFSVFDRVFLDSLINEGHRPVFPLYGRTFLDEWAEVFQNDPAVAAEKEMENLKMYFGGEIKATGLILTGLDMVSSSYSSVDTTDLKQYISKIHELYPLLTIGIFIRASEIQDYYKQDCPLLKWLNFCDLNLVIDFYVISFDYLNVECTAELKTVGIAPLNSTAEYSVISIMNYVNQYMNIPKSKLHLRFPTYPSSFNEIPCQETSGYMCRKTEKSQEFCINTQEQLYAKGKYTREIGAGFIAAIIDNDDPYSLCGCGPFPGFYSLFFGFNCLPLPKFCSSFNRENI